MKIYLDYVNQQKKDSKLTDWISTVLKNKLKKESLPQSEIEHVLDYLMSEKCPPRIDRMSYDEAKSNTEKWSQANQKRGLGIVDNPDDIETVYSFENGMTVVKLLSKKAYEREGALMRHCLGGYSVSTDTIIYSFRDETNYPHSTIEIQGNEDVRQIKGKGNGCISPKYVHMILEFLKSIGKTIRPSEMTYLGYNHIPEQYFDLVERVQGMAARVQTIMGEKYIYELD